MSSPSDSNCPRYLAFSAGSVATECAYLASANFAFRLGLISSSMSTMVLASMLSSCVRSIPSAILLITSLSTVGSSTALFTSPIEWRTRAFSSCSGDTLCNASRLVNLRSNCLFNTFRIYWSILIPLAVACG